MGDQFYPERLAYRLIQWIAVVRVVSDQSHGCFAEEQSLSAGSKKMALYGEPNIRLSGIPGVPLPSPHGIICCFFKSVGIADMQFCYRALLDNNLFSSQVTSLSREHM